MTCEHRFLKSAQTDYENVIAYLCSATGGRTAARSFANTLDEKIGLICSNPPLFALSRIPELAALGYRATLVGNYVMLYFFRDGVIYIAHIFHQRQDYARLV